MGDDDEILGYLHSSVFTTESIFHFDVTYRYKRQACSCYYYLGLPSQVYKYLEIKCSLK